MLFMLVVVRINSWYMLVGNIRLLLVAAATSATASTLELTSLGSDVWASV